MTSGDAGDAGDAYLGCYRRALRVATPGAPPMPSGVTNRHEGMTRRLPRGRHARSTPGPPHRPVGEGRELNQYESALITSPPARVPRAFHVLKLTFDLMNRTDPSMRSTLAPPGWNEPAPMNESTLPNPALTAQACWFGGMMW